MKEISEFAFSRKVFANNLRIDKDLLLGYVANVAMKIYDDQNSDQPLDLGNVDDCNELALGIINVMFNDKGHKDPIDFS